MRASDARKRCGCDVTVMEMMVMRHVYMMDDLDERVECVAAERAHGDVWMRAKHSFHHFFHITTNTPGGRPLIVWIDSKHV